MEQPAINNELAKMLPEQTIYCLKTVLTTDEAAKYMGISKGYLYKLTFCKKIPYYKPMGKMCYFKRAEVEEWMLNNRVAPDSELQQMANSYTMSKK